MKESLDSQASKTFPITLAIALALGVFAAGSEELVISPLLPDLSNSFQQSLDILALSISIYGLAVLAGAPLLVPLGDRYSRELCLIIGLSFFFIGTVMCAAAPNLAVFFAGRAASGLAAGVFVPTAYALVGDRVPYEYRGKVMGLIVSSWSLSLVLGVPIGAFIAQSVNWRWTFWLFAIMSLIVLLLVMVELRKQVAAADLETRQAREKTGSLWGALKIDRVPVYLTVTFCNMLGFYGMYSFLGAYLQSLFDGRQSAAGLLIMAYGIGFSMSMFTGKLADGFGKMRSLFWVLGGITLVLALLPYAPFSWIVLIVALFIWGALQSLSVTLLSTVLSGCTQTHRGNVMAFYSLASNFAVMLGSALMGPIYVQFGYHTVGLVCALMTLVGFIISFSSYKRERSIQKCKAV
ncbi:MFS transporter [Bacillus xiamenensis]|uniref:MFS transporter n=1 Tax=Bacillus xiamenensis TaxID=1178537 RepID=A0AAC9IGD2_9BACI|nr:MFS transporter [Bacillus xiamenensis]AOZ88947.1 MFS transporter [Bacillus xiamenensis]MBG9910247.1 MFS transporter [Bacillus xiamenensis]MCY9575120.1 MFS transporter [Bacillus xiamenensis]